MHVVLIGNYEPDGQESMQRFADLLFSQLRDRGVTVELLKPPVRFGSIRSASPLLRKWLGYVDKLVLFSRQLEQRLGFGRGGRGERVVVHICDHSNAAYVRHVRRAGVLVTCHDLLAVRSAFGEFPENPTAFPGRRLQQIILNGLRHARHVACVSEATRDDLLRLTGLAAQQVSVVPNGLNHPYSPMSAEEAMTQLGSLRTSCGRLVREMAQAPVPGYLLHVGGNQWYKNRLGVLRIYHRLVESLPDAPALVFAGKPLPDSLWAWTDEKGLRERVFAVENPDNEQLRALYSRARLLLFPSLAEGFGWPILEAQACGCVVVTAARSPMPEVGGPAAYYCNPRNFTESAALLQRVLGESARERAARVALGQLGVGRFSTAAMVRGYLALYEQLLAN